MLVGSGPKLSIPTEWPSSSLKFYFDYNQHDNQDSPNSLPIPESLYPPNGVIDEKTFQQFTYTVPALNPSTKYWIYDGSELTNPAPNP